MLTPRLANQEIHTLLNSHDHDVTLDGLTRLANIVSTEALLPSYITNAFSASAPEFFNRAKALIADAFSRARVSDFRRVDSTKVRWAADKLSYLDMVDILLPTLPGLSAPYLDLIKVLDTAQSRVDSLTKEVLKPLQQHLAVLLNDPVKMTSQSLSTGVKFKGIAQEQFSKSLAQLFKAGNRAVWKYGELFKRQSDLAEIDKQVQGIVGRYQAIDRNAVQKQLLDLERMIDTLVSRVREEPEAYKLSGPVLKQLVQLIYQTAQEVEFYGLVGYHLKALTEALAEDYEEIVKAV